MQLEVQQRWMNARQQPRFTLHTQWSHDLRVDSVRMGPLPGRRTLFVTSGYLGESGEYAHDARGRPTRITGTIPEQPRSQYETVGDSADAVRTRLYSDVDLAALDLPASRLWDLVPTFAAGPPRAGLRWSDSLELHAMQGGMRQDLTGRRYSRVVKDTVVRRRRLWIVRDSAAVHYAERTVDTERTLDTLAAVDREVSGWIRGRHLYDPALRLFRTRHDTTALAGVAVLRYPGGRAFPSRTRLERVRAWTLFDSAGLARREGERAAEEERGGNGIVDFIEANGVEDRLLKGDRRLRDSLVAAWRRSDDPEERAGIFGLAGLAGDEPPEWWEAMALEAGDTAGVVRDLAQQFYSTLKHPVTERQLRWVLPLMDDPGLAFDFGLERDPPYENAVQGLVTHPPAISPDTGDWSCTPTACALLARQRTEAREPRLRYVGLVAALALEPRRWADTVLAVAPRNPSLLGDAARLVRGAQPVSRFAEGPPLPPAGAGWRAWRAWASGKEDQERFFEKPIATTIRFHEAMTGRDIVGELRRARAEASDDSARLVFSTLLMSFGGDPVRGVDEVYAALRNGSPAARDLAMREAARLLAGAPPADTATVTALLGRMLSTMTDGAPAWRWLEDAGPNARPAVRQVSEGPHPLFIAGGPLSPALRAAWAARARIIGPGQPGPGQREAAIVFTPDTVVRVGPFARLYVRWSTTEARTPDQEPRGWAGGANVDLVLIDGEWRVIGAGDWIT
jgi:hypothetical protein